MKISVITYVPTLCMFYMLIYYQSTLLYLAFAGRSPLPARLIFDDRWFKPELWQQKKTLCWWRRESERLSGWRRRVLIFDIFTNYPYRHPSVTASNATQFKVYSFKFYARHQTHFNVLEFLTLCLTSVSYQECTIGMAALLL